MKIINENARVIVLLLLYVGVFLAIWLLPDGPLIGAADIALLSVTFGVIITYSPSMHHIWWVERGRGWPNGIEWFITGVFMGACFAQGLRSYAIIWRAAGSPRDWNPHWSGPLNLFNGIIAYLSLLVAPRVTSRGFQIRTAAKFGVVGMIVSILFFSGLWFLGFRRLFYQGG